MPKGIDRSDITCIRCNGKGYIGEHKAPCSNCAPLGSCRGVGLREEDRSMLVVNSRCRSKGKGDGRKTDKRFGDAGSFGDNDE
jgi:hypothetical protein